MALLSSRLRVLLLTVLVAAAPAWAGCTEKLSINTATIDEPSFDLEPETGDADTTFRVDARGLGERYNVTWDWGDGTVTHGGSGAHVYGFTNGVMTVTLLVTDDAGAQGIATREITLGSGENTPPRVHARTQRTWVAANQPFNVSASATDADGDPLTTLWTLRQEGGTLADSRVVATQPRTSLTIDAPGSYVLTARATDPKGGEATDEVRIDVTRTVPDRQFEAAFQGTLVAGTGGAAVSEKAWVAPAPDTDVDAARHRYTLDYPASTIVFLTWNDTSGHQLYDLDLEVRHAGNGTTVFRSETRAPAAPLEYNLTMQEAGEYEVVIRAVAGADVRYDLLVHASLQVTPEMVREREATA